MKIIKATLEHADDVSRLFDLYRQFYECEPDLDLSIRFIKNRLKNNESDIFIAIDTDKVHGFTQLYPSFCSIAAAKIYILHDLYIDEVSRKSGLGEQLVTTGLEWARENGASRIDLLTEYSNKNAQSLYEKLGFQKTLEDFHAYSRNI
ncbi:GNAT family N-acetyltransferase [Chromatiales bacterium (ex Bugula neritina AB1)]|nr:GNAT family N-acetyltransferase [Chromatiales bacterium (ex Bugula neritina AB1)]